MTQAMSDREEWAHTRAEIDRVFSLLEAEKASTDAAHREIVRASLAYEKLRNAAKSLIYLYDHRLPFDHADYLDEKIEQLREAMK